MVPQRHYGVRRLFFRYVFKSDCKIASRRRIHSKQNRDLPYKNAKGQKDTMKSLNKIISQKLDNEFDFNEEKSPMSAEEVAKLIGGFNG